MILNCAIILNNTRTKWLQFCRQHLWGFLIWKRLYFYLNYPCSLFLRVKSNRLLCGHQLSLFSKINPKKIKFLKNGISKVYGIGDTIQDVSSRVQLDFHIGEDKLQNTFYVIQNHYPLILGMDFLEKHKGVLDFEYSTITVDDKTYDLAPPAIRSTLIKSQHAQIIDAYSSRDIPVSLTRPVNTTCMLVEPISSLTRNTPGLEIPLAIVSSQTTACRITNDTDTPISIPAGCTVAIACNITVNNVTEMIDFLHDFKGESQVNALDYAHDVDHFDDFNRAMPFPEFSEEENPEFNIENPTLTSEDVADRLLIFIFDIHHICLV